MPDTILLPYKAYLIATEEPPTNDEVNVNVSETKRSKQDINILGSDITVQKDADLSSKEGNINIGDIVYLGYLILFYSWL